MEKAGEAGGVPGCAPCCDGDGGAGIIELAAVEQPPAMYMTLYNNILLTATLRLDFYGTGAQRMITAGYNNP